MTNPNIPFSRDAYDDLADLFLTEPVESGSPPDNADDVLPLPFPGRAASSETRSHPTRPRVALPSQLVAMMRVNLPVIAGPWLEQAAAAIASETGPVALIRQRGEHTTMDLVSGRDAQQAAAAAITGPTETLPATVARLRRIISCWVVEAQTNSPEQLPDWSAFDEVVLLTGADEAATVAVFAQIKAICHSARSLPRLSLVIVGSDEDTARTSGDRIARACHDSLNCTVELRAVVRRMQPVPMRHLGRFARHDALVETLSATLSRPQSASAPAARDAPVTATTSSPRVTPAAASRRVALPPRLASPASADPPIAQVIPQHIEAPTHRVQVNHRAPVAGEAAPVEQGEAASSRAAVDPPAVGEQTPQPAVDRDTLVALLSDLQPLDVECPRAAGVELAFDQRGGLHVVAEDDSDAALQRLYVACDWAREHQTLLTRLNPWLAASARGEAPEITPHLFTTRPRERRHLADGSLRIHILVRDAQSGGKVITHLDLN